MQQQPPQGPYPPQGDFPPPSQPYGQPQEGASRSSGLATAALICGLVGVIPCFALIPSVLGLILGIAAIIKINGSNGALRGKGKAIVGILISLLFMVIWPVIGYAGYNYMHDMVDDSVAQVDAQLKAIDAGELKAAYEMYPAEYRSPEGYAKFVEEHKGDAEFDKYEDCSFALFDQSGGAKTYSDAGGTFMALRIKVRYSKKGVVAKAYYFEYRDEKWVIVPESRAAKYFEDFSR